MNWKKICRSVLCLLLVCCLVLHMSPLEAKAVDPITIGMGIVAGVAGILGIGSLMIGLGVMPKPTTQGRSDFWKLAESIWNVLPDAFVVSCVASGTLGSQDLLRTYLCNGKYYVSTELVEFINKFLHTGTVSVNTSTGVVSSTAPVFRAPGFSKNVELALEYAAVLDSLHAYDPDIYDIWVNAKHCTYVTSAAHGKLFIFTNEPISFIGDTFSVSGLGGYCAFKYDSALGVWDHCVLNGYISYLLDPISITGEYRSSLALQLGRVDPADIVEIGFRVEYVEDSTGGDDEEPEKKPVVIFKPPVSQDDVVDDDQDEAQEGAVLDPSVGIDPDTGYPVGTLSNRIQVAVDAEIAVASILVALGISPGSSNADFRTLVSNVIAELPEEYFYNYESLAYGNLKLMRCWLCDGTYYFTGGVMEHINSLIYYGSDTMEPLFKTSGFLVDQSKYPGYDKVLTQIEKYRISTSDTSVKVCQIVDSSPYLLAFYYENDSGSSGYQFYYSTQPVVIDKPSDSVKLTLFGFGDVAKFYSFNSGASYVGVPYLDCNNFTLGSVYLKSLTSFHYDVYESGISVNGDFAVYESSADLSDLLYRCISVLVSSIKVLFYPVKLFDTLAQAETALQEEVQAGLDSSTWITVNVETGEIIDVITDPEPDPGVDPDPTLPPVNPDPDPDPDPDPEPDPEPDPNTGAITLLEIIQALKDHRISLLDAIRSFFEWLGTFIVSGFERLIKWLAETLIAGYRRVAEWLSDTLLAGIRNIIEWLADAVLSGIREIFVPSEDFLTTKVQALRGRFGFADSVITTVSVLGAALMDFSNSPPIIYMDLSSSESKYDWGDRAIALDLRWYERYKPTVDTLLSALLWVFFVWRVFRKLPGIISGMAGDSAFDSAGDGGAGGSRFDS